ncbi:MAG: hypothetical protein SFV15_15040 [Polyangiaceae bacterium]|nr:hypothetical protein [Polyangiaceae bacterium]
MLHAVELWEWRPGGATGSGAASAQEMARSADVLEREGPDAGFKERGRMCWFYLGTCADKSCSDLLQYRREVTVRFPNEIEASVAPTPGCVLTLPWFKDPGLRAHCKYVADPRDRALRLAECEGDMQLGEGNTVTSSAFGISRNGCPEDFEPQIRLVDVNCGANEPPRMHHFTEFRREPSYGFSPRNPGAYGEPFLVRADIWFWEGTTENEYAEVLAIAARAGGKPLSGGRDNVVGFEFPPTTTNDSYEEVCRALRAHPAVIGGGGDVPLQRDGW